MTPPVFLALLSQPGWRRAELGRGPARAVMERSAQALVVEIHEGPTLLCALGAPGAPASARAALAELRPTAGVWFDAHGEDGAWARSLGALMAMSALALGADAPDPASGRGL